MRQDDDKGHLTINYDRLVTMTDLERALTARVGSDVGVDVTIACAPAGRTVVVDKPGTSLGCTVTNATDPTDSATMTVTVDAAGTPTYTWA